MSRILILFTHPTLEKSRVHRRLLESLPDLPGLTLHDLYERYPDYDVDVPREQKLLLEHDLVIFQHPFFWYSAPPLLKQWIDLVLEHGWAYGRDGNALRGKTTLSLISAGGGRGAYTHEGYNGRTVREFLAPVEHTVKLCGMRYLPPYVVFGAHRLSDADIDAEAAKYRELLVWLQRDAIPFDDVAALDTLNDAVDKLTTGEAGS